MNTEKEKNMHKFWKFIADPTHMKNAMCIYEKNIYCL